VDEQLDDTVFSEHSVAVIVLPMHLHDLVRLARQLSKNYPGAMARGGTLDGRECLIIEERKAWRAQREGEAEGGAPPRGASRLIPFEKGEERAKA
jgi:hypothetical protein